MKITVLLSIALVICLSASAWAAAPTLTTFSAGTPARAASVNANFTAISDALPGVTNAFNSSSMYPVADTVLTSVAISCPGPGYVLLLAKMVVELDHTNGTVTYCTGVISRNRTTATYNSHLFTAVPSTAPTGSYYQTPSAFGVETISAAGTYTYYLVADNNGSGTPRVYRSQLAAVFFPEAVGAISNFGEIQLLGSPESSNGEGK
jgi:hypothetical protein